MTAPQRNTPVTFDSPAAERNKQPLLEQLGLFLPTQGRVLEIASGSGQHVVWFAAGLPRLEWLPSEPDSALREAIAARLAGGAPPNVAAPIDLDVTWREWPVGQVDAIVCINLLHIAPWAAARGLMRGAGAALPPGAPLVLYGPFRRGGRHTSESNEAFDASLRSRDSAWGVREMEEVTKLAESRDLELDEIVAMPANNFLVVYRRRC